MEKFCEQCKRELEEGEICDCSVLEEETETAEVEEIQPEEMPREPATEPETGEIQDDEPEFESAEENEEEDLTAGEPPSVEEIPPVEETPPEWQQAVSGQACKEQTAPPKDAEWIHQKKNSFISAVKNVIEEIVPTLKAPVTSAKNIAEDDEGILALQLIIAKAAIVIAAALIVMLKLQFTVGDLVKVPYLKTLGLVILLSLGADLLETFILTAFTNLANGAASLQKMTATVGVRALYDAIIVIIAAVVSLFSLRAAVFVYSICGLLIPYIQYSCYQVLVRMNENKKPYAFFVIKACMMILMLVVMMIWGGDIYSIFIK